MIFSGVGFVRPGLGSLVSRMVSRRHYITAYRKALQEELKKSSSSSSIFSPSPNAAKLDIERCLYKELNELHKTLSAAEILVFRDFVLTVLQRQGETVSSLKGAVIACSVKCVQYCNFKVKLSSRVDSENEYDTDNENENENENEDLFHTTSQSRVIKNEIHVVNKNESSTNKDSNSGYISPKEFNNVHSNGNLSMNVSLSVSRLAVTVLEEEVEIEVDVESTHYTENEKEKLLQTDFSHYQERRKSSSRSPSLSTSQSQSQSYSYRELGDEAGEIVKNIFSFVLYDTEVNIRSVRDYEKYLSVRIRSVRAYGMRGSEIIVWGGDPNDLMPVDEDVTEGRSDAEVDVKIKTKTMESALYLSLKLMGSNSSTYTINRENTAAAAAAAAAKNSSLTLPAKNIIATNIATIMGKPINDIKNKDRRGQVNVEVVMSSLTATWDGESLHRLRLLGDCLVYKHPTSSPLELLAVAGIHPYAAHRLKASQLSMSKIGGASSGDQGYRCEL